MFTDNDNDNDNDNDVALITAPQVNPPDAEASPLSDADITHSRMRGEPKRMSACANGPSPTTSVTCNYRQGQNTQAYRAKLVCKRRIVVD